MYKLCKKNKKNKKERYSFERYISKEQSVHSENEVGFKSFDKI